MVGTRNKGASSRTLKGALAVGLSLAMTLGGVPAPSLAEAVGEAVAAQDQVAKVGELAQAARDAALGLTGETAAERVTSAYALLAGVPAAAQVEGAESDVDTEALAALRGEASTPAGVARAFALLTAEVGAKAVEVKGADDSVWAMAEVDGVWRHYDPARATASDDVSWLALDDAQMAQKVSDAAPWALVDGAEAPKAEPAQVEEQQPAENQQPAEPQQPEEGQPTEAQQPEEGQPTEGRPAENQQPAEEKRPAAKDAQPEEVVLQEVSPQESAELDKAKESAAQTVADEKPQAGKKADDKVAGEKKSDSKAESKTRTTDAKSGLEAQATGETVLPLDGKELTFYPKGNSELTANEFTFTLATPAHVALTVENKCDGAGTVELRDKDSIKLDYGSMRPGISWTRAHYLDKGTYKVKVWDNSGRNSSYMKIKGAKTPVSSSYSYANNLTFNTAKEMKLGESKSSLFCRNHAYNSTGIYPHFETYYKFKLTGTKKVRIICREDANVDAVGHCVLYDSSYNALWGKYSDAYVQKGWNKTVALPKGEYYIGVTNGDYGEGPYTVKVESVDLSDAAVNVSKSAYTYDGKQKTPGVTVKLNGTTLRKDKDYTVSWQGGRTNAGKYWVKVTGKGEYGGSKTVSGALSINRASIASASVSGLGTWIYNGKARTPAPTVKAGGRTLKKGTDYTLKYSNNVKVGTAAVTITGRGNYASTKKATFKIAKDVRNVQYFVHRQTYGNEKDWSKSNGQQSGTTGESKRLEGIWIRLGSKPVSGSIQYLTHVQTYGWEKNWKSEGQMSGTRGQAKRLEAIQIRLTGEMAKNYDVYYRVHAQTYGWMGWAKNGAQAGTAGMAKRLEAIQIVLVPKGAKAPAAIYKGAKQAVGASFLKK